MTDEPVWRVITTRSKRMTATAESAPQQNAVLRVAEVEKTLNMLIPLSSNDPHPPIPRLSALMRDGQYFQQPFIQAVNHIERKPSHGQSAG